MTMRIFTFILGLLGLTVATAKIFEQPSYAEKPHVSFYSNGNKKEQTHFVVAERHGHTLRWYENGNLKSEGDFEKGVMVGEWRWLTPEGEIDLTRSGFYEEGERVTASKAVANR